MKKIKILHIFPDDKFLDAVFDLFEMVPDTENEYVYYTENKEHVFNFINNTARINMIYDYDEYVNRISGPTVDVVVFHTMPHWCYRTVLRIDKRVKVVWSAWGYDIYDRVDNAFNIIKLSLYKPLTKKLIEQKPPLFMRTVKFLQRKVHLRRVLSEMRRKRSVATLTKQTINRVDYCSTVLPVEYEMLSRLSYFRAKPFFIKYLNRAPEKTEQQSIKESSGCNILLGNSANPSNNHLDVLAILKGLKLEGREIILPLSYSGIGYKDKFLEQIKTDQNILVLDKYLPFEDYEKLVTSCNIAVFGHIRQQALGNIYLCFEKGIKVFLYKDSITYKHLTGVGYRVFKIEDLTNDTIDTPLSEHEREHNRKLVLQVTTPEILVAKMTETIAALFE